MICYKVANVLEDEPGVYGSEFIDTNSPHHKKYAVGKTTIDEAAPMFLFSNIESAAKWWEDPEDPLDDRLFALNGQVVLECMCMDTLELPKVFRVIDLPSEASREEMVLFWEAMLNNDITRVSSLPVHTSTSMIHDVVLAQRVRPIRVVGVNELRQAKMRAEWN